MLSLLERTWAMKLSPAPFISAMSIPVSSQTRLDIQVTVDNKNIRIDK